MERIYLTIVLAPLAAAIVAGLFGRRIGRAGAHSVTIAGVALSFVLSLVVLNDVMDGAPPFNGTVYEWATVGGIRIDPSFFALFFALVIYTASHIAEIVRGSIQAVDRGQGEAADAVALSGFQKMWYVVLPQAFRIAIPPIGNQYLNLIKNSSLGAGFAYFELTNVTQVTVGNGSPAVPAFFLTLLFYVVLSLVTSAIVNIANRRFKVVER